MPLTVFRRGPKGVFYVRGTILKQSVYESTGTSDPERAEEYRLKREGEVWDRKVSGPKATVTFAEAVESYLDAEERRPDTQMRVRRLLLHFGEWKLRDITQEAVDKAYPIILTARSGPASKLRGVLTPLRAIMEHAAVRKWCDRPAFKAPKVPKATTTFLRPKQATALVVAAAPHLRPLLVFLIGTGCRMSEALELEWDAVDLEGARAIVWQKQGTERHVDLPPVVVMALGTLPYREGRVFRPAARRTAGDKKPKMGKMYRDNGRSSGNQIRSGWRVACQKAKLAGHWHEYTVASTGQKKRIWASDFSPHDLRHTWASWDYCRHKDLLALKDRGGWSTLTMVTQYAKKMPEAYRPEIIAWMDQGAEDVQDVLGYARKRMENMELA